MITSCVILLIRILIADTDILFLLTIPVIVCDLLQVYYVPNYVSLTVYIPGPLFTKRTDVLPIDLVKSRSREIRI